MAQTFKFDPQYDDQGRCIRTIRPDAKVLVYPNFKSALLLTDIQSAFTPDHVINGLPIGGGGLAVTGGTAGCEPGTEGGHHVVEVALRIAEFFVQDQTYVALDQHPEGHIACAYSYEGLAPFTNLTPEIVRGWKGNGPIVSDLFDKEVLLHYLSKARDFLQTLWWEHAIRGTEQAKIHLLLRKIKFTMRVVKGMNPVVDSYSPVQDNTGVSTGLGERMVSNGVEDVFSGGLAGDICAGLGSLDLRVIHKLNVYHIKDMCRSVSAEGERKMDALHIAAGVHIITSDQLWLAA